MDDKLRGIAYKPEDRRTRSERRFVEAKITKEVKEHAQSLSSEDLSTKELQEKIESFKEERRVFYSRGLTNTLRRAIRGRR